MKEKHGDCKERQWVNPCQTGKRKQKRRKKMKKGDVLKLLDNPDVFDLVSRKTTTTVKAKGEKVIFIRQVFGGFRVICGEQTFECKRQGENWVLAN